MEAIIVASIGALVSLVSAGFLYAKSRGDIDLGKANAKTALDQAIDDRVEKQLKSAWAEIDKLKADVAALHTNQSRRDGAVTRILKALAAQWPGPEGPKLDPADIAIIEENVPPQWVRQPK